MRPRNDFERELQRYIDNGSITYVTHKQMEQAMKIMDEDKKCRMWAFNTEQTINGMKLTKCYKVHRIGRDALFTSFNLCLIYAERDGQTAWAGRGTGMGCFDSFSHHGKVSIKSMADWYKYYIDNPVLRSTGKTDPYSVVRFYNFNSYLFNDSRMETLAKSGDAHDNELLMQAIEWGKPISKHVWAAYKVAKRHGYSFQGEMWKWIALIGMLRTIKKDYHNPVNVCPASLEDAWNNAIHARDKQIERERNRRWEEARRQQLERDEKEKENFIKNKSRYFGICFGNKNINISVLDSVEAYKDEGDAMHHCVFSCAYYTHNDSIILSAKDRDGKRLATIELSLTNWKILQCRGVCNEVPKDYNAICGLVRKNVGLFKRAKLSLAS